jgi:hypothetical protein
VLLVPFFESGDLTTELIGCGRGLNLRSGCNAGLMLERRSGYERGIYS